MRKTILSLGKALNKTEQKLVNGGGRSYGFSDGECNQEIQYQIRCNHSDDVCEMDAVCNLYTNRCMCS